MSYSPKGADAWIVEQRQEIERQHGEITELTQVIDAQAFDIKDASRELDRLDRKISQAIESLRLLEEVPLRDLVASIGNILEGLK